MWLKIKVWTKVVFASLLGLYVLIFVIKNTHQEVTFWWWFNREEKSSVLVLSVISFLAGAIAAVLVRTTWRTYTQIRELQRRARQQRVEQDLAEMKSKAAMLKTRSAPGFPVTAKPAEPAPPAVAPGDDAV